MISNIESKYMSDISQKDLEDIKLRVDRVNSLLKVSANTWIEVGKEFVSAKSAFGNHAYERFVNDAGFTHPVANKLVCIGKSNVFRSEGAKQFVGFIDGWTTLYEVTKLSPNRVQDLWDFLEQNPGRRLSRNVIRKVAQGSPIDDRSIVLGVIEVLESKVDGMTPRQVALVKSKLDEIHRLIDNAAPGIKFAQRKQGMKLLANFPTANQTTQLVKSAAA